MKCPHCLVEVHPNFEATWLAGGNFLTYENGARYSMVVWHMRCPACAKAILKLAKQKQGASSPSSPILIYPRRAVRPEAPPEVPAPFAADFNESCLVIGDSPKASAALSRRCLQGVLHSQGFTQRDLAKAIDAALASRMLPGPLAENLDAIRNIGNFAAHPTKDTNSGEIVEVEEHEAEWNLDVLEGLFDFYFVQPAKDAARKAALNAKLQAANKPPMK